MINKLREYLKNRTPEQIEEDREFFRDKTPKGWISIEDHLPKLRAVDFMTGSTYKVRDADGKEFDTVVGDHNVWYHEAKAIGITHWLNG